LNETEEKAGLPKTAGYRYAEKVGRQLFIAGQVPLDSDGNLVGMDSPTDQTTQCLKNLHALITLHGFKQNDIRKLTVYVVGNPKGRQHAWEAVKSWFDGEVPPSTLLGVSGLGYTNQVVEIDATIIARES
jgi:enamine deaminase RidA (YjgF/YER057c/UK114 family)